MVADRIERSVFDALGTTVHLATTGRHDDALVAVRAEIDEIDRACSRFRADSDLSRTNAAAGGWVEVGRPFLRALRVAVAAARSSNGAVDPTIGTALRVLGYDGDFATIRRDAGPTLTAVRVPGWQAIDLDATRSRVRVPDGVHLDFGATAKALAADRAAANASLASGAGVLVSLGGDIAVAGSAPDDGWMVGIAASHRTAFADADQAVVLWAGGLATSSVTERTWRRGDTVVHHIVDPATGSSTTGCWRSVSVAAPSCVDANVSSTGAVVLGAHAAAWLIARGHPARLVAAADGAVVRLNGWPEDDR